MEKKTWSRTEVRQLIERYKANPVLWDTKSHDYRNIVKKRKAQKKLATEFNTTIVELGRKIRILRAQWLKEFKKMKEQAEVFTTENAYVSSWIWFQPLRFIHSGGKTQEDNLEDWIMKQMESTVNETDEQNQEDIYLYVREDSMSSNDERQENFRDSDQDSSSIHENIDEFQIFGNSVAEALRSMHYHRNAQELKRLILQNIEQCVHKDTREYRSNF